MGVMSVVLRKARTLTTFTLFEGALVLPVFCMLGLARLAVRLLPFRVYARHLGATVALDTAPPALDPAMKPRVKSIGRVVRSVAGVTPWASVCLPQAMVASALLRMLHLPYCVYFGLAPKEEARSAQTLDAHAWVHSGDVVLTGRRGMARFTVVQVFEHKLERSA